jgi:hypothetical protein
MTRNWRDFGRVAAGSRSGPIEGNTTDHVMDDVQKVKTRYEVALYTLNEISKRNADLALDGGCPTADDLQREEAAHQELAAARRAYLESLSTTLADDGSSP